MTKRLTQKQERFAELVGKDGLTPTEAVLQTYDCTDRKSAGNLGSENMDKPGILAAVESHVVRLKEEFSEALRSSKLLHRALEVSQQLMQSHEPAVARDGAKLAVELGKLAIGAEGKKPTDVKHLHVNFPKRD